MIMCSLGSRHCRYVATVIQANGRVQVYYSMYVHNSSRLCVMFALQVPAPLTPLQEKLLQGVLQLKDEVKLGLISCSLINCLLKTPR